MTLLRRYLLLPLLPQISYGNIFTTATTKRLPTCANINPLYRTMATSNTTPPASADASTADPAPQQQPLGLPEPPTGSKAIELDVSSGQGVALDHLGPMVVNRDGTLSRIGNWAEMSDIERKNTLRILGKRNQLRLSSLKAQEDEGQGASEK